nr:hypothetical protein [uncultured Carboxylicivirga sp.]
MKKLCNLILLILISVTGFSQIQLEQADLDKLVGLGEYYSKNVMLSSENAVNELEEFRTDKLNNIIDVMQVMAKGSMDIIDEKYLTKPNDSDLILWYVIREIHYNLTDKENQPKPSMEIAKKVLADSIDKRWLIDNYYFRIQGTIAKLFNTVDFSKIDFNLNSYGLETDFEKSALYFNLLNAFTTRFKVLQFMKNNKKIIEFADKMPTFNGKAYYEYTDFDYEDFQWIGHKDIEMYKARHLSNLYAALTAHMNASAAENESNLTNKIYWSSIMSKPDYFKYSGNESDLKKLYKKSNKKR